jgi:phage host-nuclease inhibitor protein Gam
LTFKPTAINQAPDGSLFIAGDGKVARVSEDGKVLSTSDSPHIGDLETFKQRVEEGAKKQVAEMTQSFKDQVVNIEKRIEKLKEKPEAELTDKDKKRLVTYEQQKGLYEAQAKQMEEMYNRKWALLLLL